MSKYNIKRYAEDKLRDYSHGKENKMVKFMRDFSKNEKSIENVFDLFATRRSERKRRLIRICFCYEIARTHKKVFRFS